VGRRAGDLLHGFSVITTLWPYYTAALSPPVIVAGTAAYASWLASSAARAPGWLVPAIIAVGIAAAGLIAWSLAARHWVPFAVALVGGLAAVSLAPAVASVAPYLEAVLRLRARHRGLTACWLAKHAGNMVILFSQERNIFARLAKSALPRL
jgi:hypothetical protein